MAPIKQEEQMKDKLEKRSIQPSPESWATLANRLDAEQQRKSKSMFWWVGIAASVVGILFVTTLYFHNASFETSAPGIVNTNTTKIEEKNLQIINVPTKKQENLVQETKALEPMSAKENLRSVTNNTSQIIESIKQETVVAQVETAAVEATLEESNDVKNANNSFEAQKVEDVVAQINNLKSQGKTVTDKEIDALLKKAQKEILYNKLYNETTRTVDANLLLQDVENDLQQSFRSKVFEALQSGYESVRTAVAERNN